MRKALTILTAVFFIFATISCSSQPVSETAFKVGDVYYDSLQAACDAILAGTTGEKSQVVLTKNTTGPGISVNMEMVPGSFDLKIISLNLGSHTYTVQESNNASGADFNITGGLFSIISDGGKIEGSSRTLFSLNNSNASIEGNFAVEVPEGVLLAEVNNSRGLVATNLGGSLKGNISLNNGVLTIYDTGGSINIPGLEIAGPDSALIFQSPRTTDDTTIDDVTIDKSQAEPAIPITTLWAFTEAEYDEIDKILEKSGQKVHRHNLSTVSGGTLTDADCCHNRVDIFECTDPNCDYYEGQECEGTIDPSKHELVHVDAVEPTADTSGITECQQCEDCHRYFSLDDTECKTAINPVLLATDNVQYQKMLDGGLDELNNTINELEAEIAIDKKTFIPADVSDILTLLETAMGVSDLFGSEDPKIKEILGKLETITEDIKDIGGKLSNLSSFEAAKAEWDFISKRFDKLIEFTTITDPYYEKLLNYIKDSGDESEQAKEYIANLTKEWVGNSTIYNSPAVLMNQFISGKSSTQKNYLESYDEYGRLSTGFEPLSLEYRIAMRTLEEHAMLEGYEMAKYYYEYGSEASIKDKLLEDLENYWKDYKAICNNDKYVMKTDDKNHITCWLGEYYGTTFCKQPRIVDYPGEIERSYNAGENVYRFCRISGDAANPEVITTTSVDKLIKAVNGNCITEDFYNTVYKWHCGSEKLDDIYKIFDKLGFGAVNGTAIAGCYNENIYLVADPGRDKFADDAESKTATYKAIMFYQGRSICEDWIGIGSALSPKGALECQKMFTETNLSTSVFKAGKITELGERTKCQFFTLDIASVAE